MSLLDKLQKLQQEIHQIYSSELSWEVKYDLIFSAAIAGEVRELITLDYWDPDTTYQEDVTAYVEAFNSRCQDLLPIK